MSEIYEGNSITVNKSKAKIKNRGGSYQKTTQGYNLYNIDEALNDVLKKNGDSSYTFTKTSSRFAKAVNISIPANTDFVIDYSNVKLNGNYEGNILSAIIKYTDDTDTTSSLYSTEEDRRGLRRYSKDIKSIQLYLESSLTEGTSITFSDFMIYLGSNLSKTYEPYTGGVPSPSPDFPSEIKNVGKSYNLAYPNWAEEFVNIVKDQSKAKIKEENGITFLNYLASVGYQHYDEIHFFTQIEYKENTTYSFEFDLRAEVKDVENICIEYTDGSSERLGKTNGANIWTHFRFSSNPNKTVKYLRPTYSDGSTDINVNTIQIIESPLFKPYNPYNQKQINIEINNDNSFDIDKIHRGYYDSSRYLKGLLSNDSCGQLFEIKHDTIIRIKNTSDSSWRAYCFVYDENMNNVKSVWWGDVFKSGIESSKKIDYKNNMKYVSLSILDITGIYNPEIFRQSAEVGIYDGRVYSLDNLPKYQEYKGKEITFPLAEGQKLRSLPNGVKDYLAEDGIHKNVGIIILNGSGGTNENYFKATDNKFALGVNTEKGLLLKNLKTDNLKISVLSDKFLGVSWDIMNDTIEGWQIALRQDGSYTYLRLLTTGIEDAKALETFLQNNNAIVEYPLATEEIIPYTPEQQNAFYQLQNIVLYDGINHISTDNELGSMSVEVSKIIEDYETYISSNGFFINSQYDIHYLIDFSESELPCMAEATETTVKAAGRNGDIVLSTTYDANNFNIVCYTEDNLTQEEKVKEEMKLKKLLNSIKNKTIPLAFEKDDKFYKVKYSGAFSSTNFPKHLKFSIPLKTSESYGKDLIKKVIFGNGEETSDTFEDVGAIFTIKGPANSPIISLNDYSIEYDNPLLEGDKLIINSSNSTITHINSDGVKTNAMRYYNHQFPKIENGKNVLKVLSGVNEANVSVEWYDYKF